MSAAPVPDARSIREAVRAKYAAVASSPEGHFAYPVGRAGARGLGYEDADLDRLPAALVARFVGVGRPFGVAEPVVGAAVLDVGCGCGMDAFLAAERVGPEGLVVGVDATPEMLVPARAAAPPPHLSFVEAAVEALPFEDGTFDLAFSNGVLNLVPDKAQALGEVRRVLKPDGVLVMADLVVVASVPDAVIADVGAWST